MGKGRDEASWEECEGRSGLLVWSLVVGRERGKKRAWRI
jgi:hypothetical protein